MLPEHFTRRTIIATFIMKKMLIANELIALLGGPKLIVATISPYEGAGGKLIAGDLEHLRFGRPVELIALLDRANSHLITSESCGSKSLSLLFSEPAIFAPLQFHS